MERKFCPFCGADITASSGKDSESVNPTLEFPKQLKVPLISLILSSLFPGLGQIYNGDSLIKGLAFFFGSVLGSFLFLIPGIIIWTYGMYDAYSVADKINRRNIEYKETKNRDIVLMILIPLIIMLIFVFISLFIAIQILGSLGSLFPDAGSLMNPDIYNTDYYKNFKP
jgi:TM2 domain-containing membrane protein YozV